MRHIHSCMFSASSMIKMHAGKAVIDPLAIGITEDVLDVGVVHCQESCAIAELTPTGAVIWASNHLEIPQYRAARPAKRFTKTLPLVEHQRLRSYCEIKSAASLGMFKPETICIHYPSLNFDCIVTMRNCRKVIYFEEALLPFVNVYAATVTSHLMARRVRVHQSPDRPI
jgi:hypothetical protein